MGLHDLSVMEYSPRNLCERLPLGSTRSLNQPLVMRSTEDTHNTQSHTTGGRSLALLCLLGLGGCLLWGARLPRKPEVIHLTRLDQSYAGDLGHFGDTLHRSIERERRDANALYVVYLQSSWSNLSNKWKPAVTLERIALSHNPSLSSVEVAEIVDSIVESSDQYEVDPLLVAALIAQESKFRPYVVSPGGAVGLGQLMPSTAARLGVDPFSPGQNVRGSVAYLARQLKRWEHTSAPEELALASYNAGPGAVEQYGGVPPYRATRHYVETIASRHRRFREEARHEKDRWLQANGPRMRDLFGRVVKAPARP